MRFEDVQLLANVYMSRSVSNLGPNMDDLTSEIKRRGLKLNNPIPIDKHFPCYKVTTNVITSEDPDAVVIEETDNVDARNIVMAFADGSVRLENRPVPRN